MKYLSNVAAIACCAIVTVGMTGCGGSSGSSSSGGTSSDGTCVVPAEVTAAATLDENTTRNAIKATITVGEIGRMIGGFGPSSTQKSTQQASTSILASTLGGKVKGLQKSTASVKKLQLEGGLEYGDNLPCDSGTYTFHETNNYQDVDGVESDTEEFTLSFNECVLADTEENGDKISFFLDYTMYDSVLDDMMDRVEVSSVYTFNGSVSRTYNDEYTYTDESWNDDPVPVDYGSRSSETGSGTSEYATNGLSVEYKEDGIVRELFTSTEKMSVEFDYNYGNDYNISYENLDAYYDGNYTQTYSYWGERKWSGTFDGTESYETFDEVNTTTSFNACNVSLEGESSYADKYINEYENYSYLGSSSVYSNSMSTKVSGYLTIVDGGESVDLYANGLTVSFDGNYSYGNVDMNVSEQMSLNGTVGSTGLGGSVVLDTQTPWLISSMFSENRMNAEELDFGYFYVYYSPYAGKTVLTGTNSAAIEFMLDDQNITYGTITIGDGEPVEYDNIEEMDIGIRID